ncbi:MAG: hypothetical protein HYZ34_01015 [Ignavibacteriae bacterium]|nr:hypothetical protein [Ignavibacteriota bacterium]
MDENEINISELVKGIQIRLHKALSEATSEIFNELKIQPNNIEIIRLYFILGVPFLLTIYATVTRAHHSIKAKVDVIMDSILLLFMKTFNELCEKMRIQNVTIKYEQFAVDLDEQEYCRKEFVKNFGKEIRIIKIPSLEFQSLLLSLINIRFNKYKNIWCEDFDNIRTEMYFPKLPLNVFLQWSGAKEKYTPESISFALIYTRNDTNLFGSVTSQLNELEFSFYSKK